MSISDLRRSDLNLLPALALLLEERSISRAAARHHLSQPAMSRVLQRLRETFADQLNSIRVRAYPANERAAAAPVPQITLIFLENTEQTVKFTR